MSQIVPPLTIFNYSPQCINNTSNATGSVNNNFFNDSNSPYSVSTQISINSPSNSFNKDVFSQNFNGQTVLYKTNINGELFEEIGNCLVKKFLVKTNSSASTCATNGFFIFYIYDRDNFNYGTILFTLKTSSETVLNSNGYFLDGTYLFDVIYSDGYYTYLTKDLNSITNELVGIINRGVRTLNIPPDPTGKYDPENIDKFTYFPAFYFGSYNSTYINNTVIPIQDYNLYTKINLQASLNPVTNFGNTLFQGCITNNLNFSDNNDILYFNCFSIERKFQLSQSGNILGLFLSPNQALTNTGALNINEGLKGVIIYADGDFEYLNEISFPYTYKLNSEQISNTVIVSLPIKPFNYAPPVLNFLPNREQEGVFTWNNFYVDKLNNSIIYDPTIEVQNFTLATNKVYDSYDFRTNLPGNIIGNAISYTVANKTSPSTVLHLNFTQYNFNNGTTLLTCYVSTIVLSRLGGLPNRTIIFPNVFSSSNNYIANGNILYNIRLTVFDNIDLVETQTIFPTNKTIKF